MRTRLLKLIAVLAGIGLGLALSESFFRIDHRFGYKYSLPQFKADSSTDISQRPFLQPSSLLGYEHVPGFGSYGSVGKINSRGLVGREYGLDKKKGTFRFLVLGDSIAEQGWSCDLLEGMLNKNAARLKPGYGKFEVWDSGVSGYDVHHYLTYLEHKGLGYKPDAVIIFFCLNDFNLNMNIYYRAKNGSTGYYFAISEISKVYKVNPFLMAHSYLYRFFVLRINAALVSRKTGNDGMALPEENGRYYLERVRKTCAEHGIPLFAVIFPYLKPLSQYSEGERYEYETVRKVNRELGVDALNLYDQLPERELISLRNIPEDFIHPSPEGHRRIAGKIYDFLLKDCFSQSARAAGPR